MGNKQNSSKKNVPKSAIVALNEAIIRKELLKLEKREIIKRCKSFKIPYNGTKIKMINRLIKYHTENRTLENHINNVIQNYLSNNNENINSSSIKYQKKKNIFDKQKKKNIKNTLISTDESYPENATALQISTVDIDFSRFEQTEEKYIDNVYHIYKQFEENKKDDTKQTHHLDPNIKHKCIESSKIASFMVIQLHRDLGFDLYSCLNELNNTLLSKLAYQMYNMLYPSYIWPQIKYTKGCVKCDDILYLNLSKPIKKLTETFMIDVFQCDESFKKNYLNLPTRRIFNVNITDTFSDLAQQISHIYKLPPDFMLFYSQTSSAFLRELKKSMNIIQYARNNQVINCYIVKDYNLEYCPLIIKKENIKLLQIQMRHIHQTSDNNKYCFGMPFIMSISSKQSCFDVYCMVYTHLQSVVSNRYLSPPHILKKKKVIISDNRNKFGKFNEWYWIFDKTEHSFHVRQWKRLLKYAPFELLLLPNRYYRFQDPSIVAWPIKIPDDEKINFYEHCVEDDDDGKINEICIGIKWTESYAYRTNELKRFKKSVNTIYIGEQYSEWKNEKQTLKSSVESNIKYTLYDYIENHRVNYNKLNFNKIFKEK
eukprot:206190_1